MESAIQGPTRLRSLDAFRGFVIASMLFVNMTWNRQVFHAQFFHVGWNDPAQGATFTDLVFPWFLFIMGCAIPLSLNSARKRDRSIASILLVGFRRAVLLYLLGVLLTVASDAARVPLRWTDLLRWNILQLIGAGYFVALCVMLLSKAWQVGFVVGVLAVKLFIMTLIPWETVSALFESRAGADAPLGPGTFAHHDAIKRTLNLEHVEPGPLRWIFGWLGMAQQFLPCAAIAVMGGWVTLILRSGESTRAIVRRLFVFGLSALALAYILQWGYDPAGGGLLGRFTTPFSKWTFSTPYCLLSVGTGTLLLLVFWLLVDVLKSRALWFLRVYGVNALVLYVGSELFFKVIASKWLIPGPQPGSTETLAGGVIAWTAHWSGSPAVGAWCFVLSWLVLWWLICFRLERRGIFIKL